jgi:hypothetical protein
MKRHMSAGIVALMCVGLFCSYTVNYQAQAQGASQEKITVLTPLGTPPPIKLRPMAPRPASLEGKTVYVLDQGYPNSDKLMMEVTAWFEKNMPGTKAVFRRMGRGSKPSPGTPDLFAEIKKNADAVVIGTGH